MASEIEEVLTKVENTLQGKYGIVRDVRRILNSAGTPRVYSATTIINSITTYNHSEVVGDTGAVGFDWNEAAIGAVGECIERYCCAVYNHSDLVYATKNELGEHAIGMDKFEIYTEKQQQHPVYPFPAWNDDYAIHWAEGYDLETKEQRYVPACLSYIPYQADKSKNDDFMALAVSSGQACHTDLDIAVLSGICEVIERDAFMIVWSKKIAVPRIDYMKDPELARLYEEYFKCDGVTFHIFDMTLDMKVPSILCILEGTSARGPYMCIGAATRPNYRDAIVKAWMEASQGMVWALSLIDNKPDWRPEKDYVNVRDFEDHVRLYCEPEMIKEADFLLKNTEIREVDFYAIGDSIPDALDYCHNEVKLSGLEVIVTDLTTDDIKSSDFVVPKVFIPGSAMLYAVHGLPSFGAKRFDSVPEKLGLDCLPPGQFNTAPHPFP